MIDEKKLIKHLIECQEKDGDEKEKNFLEDMIWLISSQPQVGGWIPVSEKLPEEGYGVLATVNGKHNNTTFIDALEIAEYDSDEGWIIEGYLDWINPDVTAWQPLPEPFKESEKE